MLRKGEIAIWLEHTMLIPNYLMITLRSQATVWTL